MASLIKKKKGNRLYYYLVESARVDGQPRIVHQAYLGTAEKLAELVQQKSAPVPLSATLRDFGLPGALWLAAKQSGLWPLLESLWPAPRSGPGPAHYLLLAAIHRICDPGPKTEVSDWYDRTILASEWGFPAERFTSQAFWDAFEQILPETSATLAPAEDLLDQNQIARDTVTLVFDKGTAALDNTVQLQEAGVGWISALPWNQAPAELRERATEELPPCSAEQPGVRAVAEKLLVHGQEYLAVLKYSAPFAAEQLHSLTTSISRTLQSLRRFSKELNKPRARWTEASLDRQQDPHPRLLLHAGHLCVAVCASPSQSRLERSFHGTTHRRVAADSAVHSALSAARRERPSSRGPGAFEANFGATGFGQGPEAGRAADYPPWVIPTGRLKLHKKELLGICRTNPQ